MPMEFRHQELLLWLVGFCNFIPVNTTCISGSNSQGWTRARSAPYNNITMVNQNLQIFPSNVFSLQWKYDVKLLHFILCFQWLLGFGTRLIVTKRTVISSEVWCAEIRLKSISMCSYLPSVCGRIIPNIFHWA